MPNWSCEIDAALSILSPGDRDLLLFSDCLRTHRCHNFSLPDGITDSLYDRTWEEITWQMFNSFKYPSVSENAQVGIGFLLKEMWKVGTILVAYGTPILFVVSRRRKVWL